MSGDKPSNNIVDKINSTFNREELAAIEDFLRGRTDSVLMPPKKPEAILELSGGGTSEAQACARVLAKYRKKYAKNEVEFGCFTAAINELNRQELEIAGLKALVRAMECSKAIRALAGEV